MSNYPYRCLPFPVLLIAALVFWSSAVGQEIRIIPIRSAPLGSPVGTVGDPVTPEFNATLGCWEYTSDTAGFEVDLELQANGWGNAAGAPTLGAVQGTIDPGGYSNGQGGDLNPKGWPATPGDGAYQAKMRCEDGGDLSPCVPPFDQTCDDGNNGDCVLASNWVMPECALDFPAIATPTLAYGWAVAAQVICNVDDGEVKTMGGLILEVPGDAAGTYMVALDSDPNNSFMTAGTGAPIPGVTFTPACITIVTGVCCSNIGTGMTICEDGLTEDQCGDRPGPQVFRANKTCDGPTIGDDCGNCIHDGSCDDGNACTANICDMPPGEIIGFCLPPQANYNPGECCDPGTGAVTIIDDGIVCTIDICHPDGTVSHNADPDCLFDIDAFPKNRYVSFETGVITVDLAFHVRMTASVHFPGSLGDLGWVGVPDADGTALVVPDPVFLPSWPAVVRAGDCEIGPGATYEIRATGDGVNFDPAVAVDTTAPPTPKFWGDIVGDFNGQAWEPPNGVQNFSDVQAAIHTFLGVASAAPLTWADVEPEVPNRIVNINDVFTLVLAFTAEPYPFPDPANCP